MKQIFTATAADELWEEAEEAGKITCYSNGCEEHLIRQDSLVNGQEYFIPLRPGLELDIINFQILEIHGYYSGEGDIDVLTLAFPIEGINRTQNFGIKKDYYESAGESYLFYLAESSEIEEYVHERDLNIRIRVEPELLRTLCVGQEETLPDELKPFLKSNFAPLFHRAVGRTTKAMQKALREMLD